MFLRIIFKSSELGVQAVTFKLDNFQLFLSFYRFSESLLLVFGFSLLLTRSCFLPSFPEDFFSTFILFCSPIGLPIVCVVNRLWVASSLASTSYVFCSLRSSGPLQFSKPSIPEGFPNRIDAWLRGRSR